MSNYFDISPPITERIGVFPGDVGFKRKVSLDFKTGHNLLLSSIESTLHLGAHTDGPNHYRNGLKGISSRDLSYYMGKAQVVHTRNLHRGERIGLQHVSHAIIESPRVLFRTESFPDPNAWNSDFCSLSPELIKSLAKQGVRLVGIDTPSIDPEDSKDLPAHQAVADHDLAILEGIVLTNVPEGVYTLIALPLALVDADASPVRAILLKSLETLHN